MNIFEKLLGTFSLEFKSNSSGTKQKISKSSTGHIAGRDVIVAPNQPEALSNLEKQVLKILNREYKINNHPRRAIVDIHNELEIREGHYVGLLNSSSHLKVDGEYYVMTDTGIRYMDNLDDTALEAIILPAEQRKKEIDEAHIRQVQIQRMEENRRRNMNDSSR